MRTHLMTKALVPAAAAALALGGALVPAGAADQMPGMDGTSSWTTSWTPTASDTCSTQAHAKYAVKGPDGQTYDSWHPAKTIDPTTGKECTFGHEHGDDPKTSDIYDWTVQHLGGGATGIPFGSASTASEIGAAADGTIPHRHEDHPGYKIYVRNQVKQVAADRSGYLRTSSGKILTCSYLIKIHQGSHSADALSNNAHELMYAVRCNDGTGMVVNILNQFGSPNEYTANCDGRKVKTSGSVLPPSTTGERIIPDKTSTDQTIAVSGKRKSSDRWGLYEVWKADTTLTAPDGHALARFDPWFGVRNPSRIADGSQKVATNTLAADAKGWPWTGVSPTLEQTSTASPFNGGQRDFYVQHSTVENASGPTTWYTDAYGHHASTKPFPGSILQYISRTSNTAQPEVERENYGMATDYAPAGSGVHAPN